MEFPCPVFLLVKLANTVLVICPNLRSLLSWSQALVPSWTAGYDNGGQGVALDIKPPHLSVIVMYPNSHLASLDISVTGFSTFWNNAFLTYTTLCKSKPLNRHLARLGFVSLQETGLEAMRVLEYKFDECLLHNGYRSYLLNSQVWPFAIWDCEHMMQNTPICVITACGAAELTYRLRYCGFTHHPSAVCTSLLLLGQQNAVLCV